MRAEQISVGGKIVPLTRPEKILFPTSGIAKHDLVDYYRKIAPTMLPYLRDRPISMQRYPDGLGGEGFFQKERGRYFPSWIETASMPKKGGTVHHVICNDAATLVFLASQAVVTPHIWLSCVAHPHNPDLMVFDFDPSADEFPRVRRAAIALRGLLEKEKLASCPMLTGSRGVHVIVSLDRRRTFDEVRSLARAIAERLVNGDPDHLTMEVLKNNRHGRIFVDVNRNGYAQTAVPPYAVRAREGAPVATPVTWDELEDRRLTPDRYTIKNIFDRLRRHGDPMECLLKNRRKLAA